MLAGARKRCTGGYTRALWESLSCENKKHILLLILLLEFLTPCSHNLSTISHEKCQYLLDSRALLLAGARKRCTGGYTRALWASLSGENKKHIFLRAQFSLTDNTRIFLSRKNYLRFRCKKTLVQNIQFV